MKAFEILLNGYDGSTDSTDHLILWVTAESLDMIKDCLGNREVVVNEIFEDWREKFGDDYVDYIYGFDFNLPEQIEPLLSYIDNLE